MMNAWNHVWRWLGLGAGVAVLAIALLAGRVLIEGESHMRDSDAAFDRGDLRGAVLHARRAAVLYAPGAPHVDRAYQRLVAVAVGAESSGDRVVAALAWRGVRGAALESRHVTLTHYDELARANASLARLATYEARDGSAREARERAVTALSRDDAPRPLWGAALLLGLLLTVFGFVFATMRGVGTRGRLVARPAALGGAITLVGVLVWTLAALHA